MVEEGYQIRSGEIRITHPTLKGGHMDNVPHHRLDPRLFLPAARTDRHVRQQGCRLVRGQFTQFIPH